MHYNIDAYGVSYPGYDSINNLWCDETEVSIWPHITLPLLARSMATAFVLQLTLQNILLVAK